MPCSDPDADPPPVPGARLDAMRPADVERVLEIEHASFATPWRSEHFLHEISENRFALNPVVRVDDVVQAYACVWEIDEELWINNLAVAKHHRRRGLGRWLLRRVLDGARERGCRVARLEVRPTNRGARGLYEAHGFREVGRRKGYYQSEGEDAIVMERPL